MIDLDVKDKKILYYLEQDCRQSLRSLGKKVGLSKDVVSNRIKNLEEKGIIFNYYTVINTFKLDLTILRFYIKLHFIEFKIKNEIIDHFLENKHTNVVASIEGSYDLVVIFTIKNIHEIYHFWEKILDKFRDYIESYNFSLYYKEQLYDYRFLLDNEDVGNDRKKHVLSSSIEQIEIDKLDYDILRIIASDARIPTIEIAKKLKTTASIVHYKIKKLINSGLIMGYRTTINFSKLGLKLMKCDIFLKDHKVSKKIMKYIEKNPFLRGRDISIGNADIELTFFLKDVSSLNNILQDLSNKFPGVIRNYKYYSEVCIHKYMYVSKEF
jgi:Lrp/AsnC family transcriptional regulator for asnA, asnC and gidA